MPHDDIHMSAEHCRWCTGIGTLPNLQDAGLCSNKVI